MSTVQTSLPEGLFPGPAPASTQALLDRLAALGIAAHTQAHAPVFTVEEAKALRGMGADGHSKNLFLKDKTGSLFLVVALQDSPIDLKTLHQTLGCGRLSFGKPELLWQVLGVIPGSVTPFALINDHAVRVVPVFERRMMAFDPLHFHPLRNDQTTAISPAGLLRFVEACGHTPRVIDVPLRADAPLEQRG